MSPDPVSVQGKGRVQTKFQRYDKDWEEYVDLEPTDIIENKDKLKVSLLSSFFNSCC